MSRIITWNIFEDAEDNYQFINTLDLKELKEKGASHRQLERLTGAINCIISINTGVKKIINNVSIQYVFFVAPNRQECEKVWLGSG